MNVNAPHFITDLNGNKVSVILPVKEYERLIEELEELEDILLYDEAKSSKQEYVPIEEVFQSIETKRQKSKTQMKTSIHYA